MNAAKPETAIRPDAEMFVECAMQRALRHPKRNAGIDEIQRPGDMMVLRTGEVVDGGDCVVVFGETSGTYRATARPFRSHLPMNGVCVTVAGPCGGDMSTPHGAGGDAGLSASIGRLGLSLKTPLLAGWGSGWRAAGASPLALAARVSWLGSPTISIWHGLGGQPTLRATTIAGKRSTPRAVRMEWSGKPAGSDNGRERASESFVGARCVIARR